ncbi:MAG: nucleotidyltransferase family protein [Candidatus Aminicenantes bacterium]|nr:nucleotidyltransferase family protein [Candidatus Aminicenantes bacterium]
MSIKIRISKKRLTEFCRRNHIRRLAFFGSVLRDDFSQESDVDVLVEFEPGHTPGLDFITMQDEMSEILGRKVDLNTTACLSPYFRNEVLNEAEVVYDAAYDPLVIIHHMLDHASEAVERIKLLILNHDISYFSLL